MAESPSTSSPGTVSQAPTSPTTPVVEEVTQAPDTETPAAEPPVVSAPAPSASVCAPLTSLTSLTGNLATWLLTAPITPPNSGGFKEPGGTELAAFEGAFRTLLTEGPNPQVVQDLAKLGYGVSTFRNDSGGGWLVVREQGLLPRGGGTFIINLFPARNLWLEAPHADSDEGTLRQTASQLVTLGARALLITGSNRCAVTTASPCSGSTSVCGTKGLRISDTAHYGNNFFTAAHRALRDTYPDAIAASIHGMDAGDGPEAAVVSDGTGTPRPEALSNRLRDALNTHLAGTKKAFSCNSAEDSGKHRTLCGTSNVQGRIDNGAADACYSEAPAATDRFIHLEQSATLRGTGASSRAVMQALADTVPCTLAGSGLGCQAVAAQDCP
ncbi:hypothetical protein D7X55_03100 [Corallococcus sp. AB049A]|uniref:Uncharacterized protein n=1 Tax=Corallococcus interemptor TaxID=2316720 RepID=A0A3A8QIA3_9BACT|nr:MULTISPECIES: hypothetical protein [Corallococcus]RKH51459.1 hypothetical protein D7Y23_10135 [Corallococcus sp. AB050B]RKH68436.1 hypothetical protein D7X96_17275 [Corallococcus interemptor]RKI74177.1 hypothetical protein D7X55_03100 [Corallococcus sp. AB049A]